MQEGGYETGPRLLPDRWLPSCFCRWVTFVATIQCPLVKTVSSKAFPLQFSCETSPHPRGLSAGLISSAERLMCRTAFPSQRGRPLTGLSWTGLPTPCLPFKVKPPCEPPALWLFIFYLGLKQGNGTALGSVKHIRSALPVSVTSTLTPTGVQGMADGHLGSRGKHTLLCHPVSQTRVVSRDSP